MQTMFRTHHASTFRRRYTRHAGMHVSAWLPLLLCLATLTGLHAQTASPTAQAMAKLGFVDVRRVDSTIQVSLMYSRADNFTGHVLYTDLREAYLHPKAASALAKAQRLLREKHPELSLKVYDAARPMHIQQRMWNTVAGTSKAIYVSNPKNGGGLHNYGMAVDITLCNAKGDTLAMGTHIDYLGRLAHIDTEEEMERRGEISKEARRNRELLRSVMRQAGFRPLRTEWWHFNFITRAEAKARYKVIP
ncbi:MAG: M15 family metallopeptidase [Clostridium sp.]|nr:M15 family metallopeptidase [Clostridium sp.]